ncbi:membrane protein insertase YidC [Pararhodospirillum photometricum]|uniref:Membrane protein insertase YidC n=1 Tax=Pararhodospirillum photometricum DSM 122 TaxID=1150469 RepID=H6SKC1_PARPM|nr:membrane protein insertase YidC [Pararhodospirillum photometricum]CCG08436.1 Protein translocase subunit yidC [Pararhodospirillum photometricum DSM 122]
MPEQRNLIVAIVLSMAVLFGYEYFFAPKTSSPETGQPQAAAPLTPPEQPAAPTAMVPPGGPGASVVPEASAVVQTRAQAVAGARIAIETPALRGSLRLQGARLDDLTLRGYTEQVDPTSPEIDLLSPTGAPNPYYAEFGWTPAQAGVAVPGADTPWQSDATTLTQDKPVTLTWDNGQGLRFVRKIVLDDAYMFTITQTVENTGGQAVTLYPYGLISRTGTPPTLGYYILHEGPLGVFDGALKEVKYKDLKDDENLIAQPTTGGWIGITDKYWLTALVPDQKTAVNTRFLFQPRAGTDGYQVDFMGGAVTVAPGQTISVENHLFAGVKKVDLLDRYQDGLQITNFDLAIDFGWFYFLTKPFFLAIKFLHGYLGNMGLAILAFTVVLKILFYPLANKSYVSMSKMKLLAPEMKKLQERFGEDRVRLNQEMMALYQKEKVNPLSGCLPILVQIPVFFALYKVLFVSIEMWHAPFYGWIHDLSAPDPTSLFNLFGLIPWDPPNVLMIGAWPCIMGLTMYVQQKLNPTPTDPTQAKIMMLLPFIFTYMLGHFAAGLVIYWTWNNALSILQQWVIMKRLDRKQKRAAAA